MAKCPICKLEQYGYNWVTTKNNKKWLQNSNGQWHDCPASTSKFKSNETFVKRIPLIDKDLMFCYLCDRFILTPEAHIKYPTLFYISMEEHLKTIHPNKEILDDIDFKAVSEEEKDKIRIKWNQPKRTTPYSINKKLVK